MRECSRARAVCTHTVYTSVYVSKPPLCQTRRGPREGGGGGGRSRDHAFVFLFFFPGNLFIYFFPVKNKRSGSSGGSSIFCRDADRTDSSAGSRPRRGRREERRLVRLARNFWSPACLKARVAGWKISRRSRHFPAGLVCDPVVSCVWIAS